MNENNQPIALFTRILELCESLQAENERLRKELDQQFLIRAVMEYRLKPKKRGRKPSPKPQINNVPGIPGRPLVFTDEKHEMLIEIVDTLKEQKGFKTDTDALTYFLEVFCVDRGKFKSMHNARTHFVSLQVQLSKARKKNKQPTN